MHRNMPDGSRRRECVRPIKIRACGAQPLITSVQTIRAKTVNANLENKRHALFTPRISQAFVYAEGEAQRIAGNVCLAPQELPLPNVGVYTVSY